MEFTAYLYHRTMPIDSRKRSAGCCLIRRWRGVWEKRPGSVCVNAIAGPPWCDDSRTTICVWPIQDEPADPKRVVTRPIRGRHTMSTVSLIPQEQETPTFLAETPRLHQRMEPFLNACLFAVALLVLASYALVAMTHGKDRFQVNFISGIYTTLAARLNDGVFYPPLDDGTHYGGTRYMPLPFVLQAGLERITGDYLVAGKLLAYGLTVVLGFELFVILRRIGCGRGVALALISLVLTSNAGFLATTTIRGDLLPVVLQLAALLVGTPELTRQRVGWAG